MDSAVIARIAVPSVLRLLRQRFDPTAALGVPAHVTLLYPFLSPGQTTLPTAAPSTRSSHI